MTNLTNAESKAKGIRFLLNDEPMSVQGTDPTKSVLSYLRYDLGLVGSKEGCAEGDCGACTVVLGELLDGAVQMRAVNACIQFVPTLDGKALYTVEYLRQANGSLHPVQQAMVDSHGSQCGFCTPGFVMSLWNVYIDHLESDSVATDLQLRTALSGNLCRCTGYRPILEAGKKMFDLPNVEFERKYVMDQLTAIQRDEPFEYQFEETVFHAPRTLEQFIELRVEKPEATILAGCTDIGLWVNKQFRDLGDIIYVGNVVELKQIQKDQDAIHIGAGVSLTDAYAAISGEYPQIIEQWKRFASVPIRNAGTLGGNVANGSPIGDSMPWLVVLGAQVVLTGKNKRRKIPLEELYLDYMMKAMDDDEVVEAIEVPLQKQNQHFRTYKLSKRYDSDISAVCAAFAITLNGGKVTDARIAFGGMAATPKRSTNTEAAMAGQIWNEQTVQKAISMLAQDYSPLSDMRASSDNRLQSAENLLYRFFLETRPDNPLADEQVSVFAAA